MEHRRLGRPTVELRYLARDFVPCVLYCGLLAQMNYIYENRSFLR